MSTVKDGTSRLDHHWMAPLLAPRTIAIVGASNRAGSVGANVMAALQSGRYDGQLWPINPRYEKVAELDCVGSMADLPSPPDLAVLSVASERMESVFADAIEQGARSLVIFDPCMIENDSEPKLLDRLKARAKEARIPVCGGNGVGFYNFVSQTFACFSRPIVNEVGHIAAFCHSGSVFGMVGKFDPRFRFNLLTSQGQEINGSVAEYMDYALELDSTRVLALFLESVRDPERFLTVLEKARDKDVPVVATKVGRTARSAFLATTHSGAVAGSDSAFDAVCDKFGVLRTDDLDGLMATAQILAMPHRVGPGDLAAVLDSGGLREQLIDMAGDMGVPLADLTDDTTKKLRGRLPHMLEAVNPVDAAGPLRDDYEDIIIDSVGLVAGDPNVAITAHEIYITDTIDADTPQADAALTMAERFGKPFIVINSFGTTSNAQVANRLMDGAVPLINGLRPALTAIRHAFAYRESRNAEDAPPETVDGAIVAAWRERLGGGAIDESAGLAMLSDFGVPVAHSTTCATFDEAKAAAAATGYPIVMKTAEPGIAHKSDVGGVRLGISDEDGLAEAYGDISGRLGPSVTVAAMVPRGVELAFGMVRDVQFGPIVMVGAGGTLIESLDDRCFGLPPFGEATARRLLGRLKLARLLQGVRGAAPADMDALAFALSRFSVLAAALGDLVPEIDANPVIAGPDGAVAVDVLVEVG
ncbi:MAG: acetate--CoA ligase family protein [Pseudomonadota bacterium]